MTAPANTIEVAATPQPPLHPLAEFWLYFKVNKGAVVGLLVVLVIALTAIFADIIAPHPPNEQYRDALLMPPVWQEGGTMRFLLGTDAAALGRTALGQTADLGGAERQRRVMTRLARSAVFQFHVPTTTSNTAT